MINDRPAFVLYLRPFTSDGALLYSLPKISRALGILSLTYHLDFGRALSFEEMLSDLLRSRWLLIAVGGDERLIGPGRIHTADDVWKEKFETLARHAELVFVVPSSNPSTFWEITWLHDHGLLVKTLFLMPPKGNEVDYSESWHNATLALQVKGIHLPDYSTRGAAFRVDPRGHPTGLIEPGPCLFRANLIKSIIRRVVDAN